MTLGSGILILTVLAGVTVFLVAQSLPALLAESVPGRAGGFWRYVGPLAFGTVWVAALALLIATPISLGVALFITHYAPRRLSAALGCTVDLLAAIPSVVFGLWGITTLAPALQPVYAWLAEHAGWSPLFAGPVSGTGRTVLTAAIVLAVMVIPLVTALCREVFAQTPRLQEEAALALGATRWEMIRTAVLPPARGGIVSAVMLGLGRALGETFAVAMVLSPAAVVSFALVQAQNPNTIAANIALQFPEATGLSVNVLVATGLVLFGITLAVNAGARMLLARTGVRA